MKIIAFSQRVLRAPGSGRAWTRDRPTGPRTLLVSYRSFRSSMRLMSSVYAAAKPRVHSEYGVLLSNPLKTSQKKSIKTRTRARPRINLVRSDSAQRIALSPRNF